MARHKTKSMPNRNIRLADQIQKDLALIIQREFNVSQVGLITISSVDLSADYAHAKVYFTVLGAQPEAAEQALNDKSGWLHAQLFRLLHIHTVPSLKFIHDDMVARGIEMTKLIEQANSPSGAKPGNNSDSD